MTKRVFLYATGDDFAAMDFEQHFVSQTVYEEMVQAGVKEKIIETDDYYIELELLEFSAIDDQFIAFIQNRIQDYDQAKAQNFFEVKPV